MPGNSLKYVHLPATGLVCLLACGLHLSGRFIPARPLHFHPIAAAPVSVAEARLALGLKIPLKYSGVYELELIKGISDTLAYRLVKAKWQILINSLYSQGQSTEKALEVVHGIGEKKAATFSQQLSLGGG